MASFEKIPFFVITGRLCVINFRVKLPSIFAGLLLIKISFVCLFVYILIYENELNVSVPRLNLQIRVMNILMCSHHVG